MIFVIESSRNVYMYIIELSTESCMDQDIVDYQGRRWLSILFSTVRLLECHSALGKPLNEA